MRAQGLPAHLLRELNTQQYRKTGTQGQLSLAMAWSGPVCVSQGGLPGRQGPDPVASQFSPGRRSPSGPACPPPGPGLPGCAPHTPLSSAGPSAAAPGPARQPLHPRADSRTACRVGDLRSVARGQRGGGVKTRRQVGSAGAPRGGGGAVQL